MGQYEWLWHMFISFSNQGSINEFPQIFGYTSRKTCNTFGNSPVWYFNGSPFDKAKTVTDWLQQNGFSVLFWPDNSRDLYLLENLWRILKQKVSKRKPINYVELMKWISDVCHKEISAEYCKNLAKYMPLRISAVKKARGGVTKYIFCLLYTSPSPRD